MVERSGTNVIKSQKWWLLWYWFRDIHGFIFILYTGRYIDAVHYWYCTGICWTRYYNTQHTIMLIKWYSLLTVLVGITFSFQIIINRQQPMTILAMCTCFGVASQRHWNSGSWSKMINPSINIILADSVDNYLVTVACINKELHKKLRSYELWWFNSRQSTIIIYFESKTD